MVGNSSILHRLKSHRRRRSNVNYFIVQLAIAGKSARRHARAPAKLVSSHLGTPSRESVCRFVARLIGLSRGPVRPTAAASATAGAKSNLRASQSIFARRRHSIARAFFLARLFRIDRQLACPFSCSRGRRSWRGAAVDVGAKLVHCCLFRDCGAPLRRATWPVQPLDPTSATRSWRAQNQMAN